MVDPCEKNLSHSRMELRISHKTTGMLEAEMAFNVVDETLPLADEQSELCAILRVPKRSLINVPRWDNCTYLPFSAAFSYVIDSVGFKVM
jgi:hypothetical protein